MNNSTQLVWVRSEDGIIGGVCQSFARQLNLDPWLIRLAWLLSLCALGTGFLVYILCVIALPRTDRLEKANEKMVLGVCTRLARRENLELGLVRLIALVLLVISFGIAFAGYLILHFILPMNPSGEVFPARKSIV